MQLIHSIYDLQSTTEIALWKNLYYKAARDIELTDVKFKKIAAPIITRWWTVGVTASDFLENYPIFIQLCKNIRNTYTSENARNKIASGILSLCKEAVIISDTNLIACYHDAFLNNNFAWLQKGDKAIGNSPGFLGRHMLARYYLMHLQLSKLMNSGWKTSEEMKIFTCHLKRDEMKQEMDDPSNPNQRITYKIFQERKADLFFSDSLKALEKHYKRYSQELLFLSLYGEAFVTQTVARIILNKDMQMADGFLFKSEAHQVQVNVNDFAKFVKVRVVVSDQLLSCHIQRVHRDDLQKLAGEYINNSNLIHSNRFYFNLLIIFFQSDGQDVVTSPELYRHWLRYKEDYAALPTTTHFVERSVKISNVCRGSSQSRCEERTSQFAICYNNIHDVNDIAKEEMLQVKHEKGEAYKDTYKLKARGKARQGTAISNVIKRHQTIEKALESATLKDSYKKIEEQINIKAKSFKSVRQQKEYEYHVSKSSKARKENQYERLTGFDITAAMANKVRFSAATMAHREGIELELRVRGVEDLSNLKNLTAMKNLLKELCAKEDDISVKDCLYFKRKSSYDWLNKTKK